MSATSDPFEEWFESTSPGLSAAISRLRAARDYVCLSQPDKALVELNEAILNLEQIEDSHRDQI